MASGQHCLVQHMVNTPFGLKGSADAMPDHTYDQPPSCLTCWLPATSYPPLLGSTCSAFNERPDYGTKQQLLLLLLLLLLRRFCPQGLNGLRHPRAAGCWRCSRQGPFSARSRAVLRWQ